MTKLPPHKTQECRRVGRGRVDEQARAVRERDHFEEAAGGGARVRSIHALRAICATPSSRLSLSGVEFALCAFCARSCVAVIDAQSNHTDINKHFDVII